jgi:hypothetical protein
MIIFTPVKIQSSPWKMINFVLTMVELVFFFFWPNEEWDLRCKFDKNTVVKAIIGSGYGILYWDSGIFST